MTVKRVSVRGDLIKALPEILVARLTDKPQTPEALYQGLAALIGTDTIGVKHVRAALAKLRKADRAKHERRRWVWTSGGLTNGFERPAGWVRVEPIVEVKATVAKLTIREVP